MGLFDLFVEKVEDDTMISQQEIPECEDDVLVDVEAELAEVNTASLIDDIYECNKLQDKTRSIFKVEELINSLPKEMVTETKKATVLAILGSFGLTVEEVAMDGYTRTDILNAIKNNINEEYSTSIANEEKQIEEHKKAIAELELAIASEKEEMKVSNETISEETERIGKLIEFIRGDK